MRTERLARETAPTRAQTQGQGALHDELRWTRDDNGNVVDQHGRDSAACRSSAVRADRHAAAARAAVSDLLDSAIVLGRLGGDKQVRRLQMSADLFEVVAARDNRWADLLDDLDGDGERR